MQQVLEAIMVICFGISWPSALIKSYTSRTIKGKSLIFLLFILAGYLFGILAKVIGGKPTYVLSFYIINFIMVFIDLCLYFRNRRFDLLNEA